MSGNRHYKKMFYSATVSHRRRCQSLLFYATALLLLAAESECAFVSNAWTVFDNPQPSNSFRVLTVDPTTQQIYVGAVNNLYSIYSTNMTRRWSFATGPEDDSFECTSKTDTSVACTNSKKSTNSDTKAIALNDKNSQLIECSNLYQGRCTIRNMHTGSIVTESTVPRVSNLENGGARVFIAPGPGGENKLYVGSTFAWGERELRDTPAVSTLNITGEGIFEAAFRSQQIDGTWIQIQRGFRSKYVIRYVGGFHENEFAYFATRQPKRSNDVTLAQREPNEEIDEYHSKLVRVCTNDQKYFSYAEVPLECKDDTTDYTLLQDFYVTSPGFDLEKKWNMRSDEKAFFGVFKDPKTKNSALCVFTIQQIEKVFKNNIMDCYNGKSNTVGEDKHEWFKFADCKNTKYNWDAVMCGKDVIKNIYGIRPISAAPALVHSKSFTSIVVSTTTSYAVAFIGTIDGKIIKAVIHDSSNATEYEQLDVAKDPILQDMEIGEKGSFLYAMTKSKVMKIPTSTCDEYSSSCAKCLSHRDPYCGWCMLSNQCINSDLCATKIPIARGAGWLSYQESSCPSITEVEPNQMQISTASFVNLKVSNLKPPGRVRCSFRFDNGMHVESEPTELRDGELRCATPVNDRIPKIPSNSSHIRATLNIVSEHGLLPLASTTFTFFDCNSYRSCSQCAGSDYPCDWCLLSDRCLYHTQSDKYCTEEPKVNGLKRLGPSSRRGPEHCPHIMSATKLYVAAGDKKNISVDLQHYDRRLMEDFYCEFSFPRTVSAGIGGVENQRELKSAQLIARGSGDSIVCDEMHFDNGSFDMSRGKVPVTFNVLWTSQKKHNNKHALDNIGASSVSIEVYRCEALASNCGECLTLNADSAAHFDCGWCAVTQQCTRRRSCRGFRADDWIDTSQLCPHPIIEHFEPQKAPIGGSTKVTIRGKNLGRSVSDVREKNAVTVANRQCDVIADEYKPASQIVCQLPLVQMGVASKGPVVVRLMVNETYTALKGGFEFVDPVISTIEPKEGPRSGGTDIKVFGAHLDAGNDAVVRVGQVPCKVHRRTEQMIECRIDNPSSVDLSASSEDLNRPQQVSVAIDRHYVRSEGQAPEFNFSFSPTLTSISPNKLISGGGIIVDVTGTGFDLLQRPRLSFRTNDEKRYYGPVCDLKDAKLMLCYTPIVPSEHENNNVQAAVDFDGHLSESKPLDLVPNPEVTRFNETRYYRPGNNDLSINGRDLDRGVKERDISITVGGEPCNLTALAQSIITCRPPPKPQLEGDLDPEVILRIGNLTFAVGQISYDQPNASGYFLVILIIIVAVMILLVCIAILYKKKTTLHQRQMKYLKNQMDTIEMKVATECKEAFAELQTSLNQYNAEIPLGASVVPFLKYKDYCARVLFPNNQHNHPVLRELEVDSQRATAIEAGLREFHKLLMNKTFFLTMVRTMESNKYFLGKDRVYVGSLLMVVLQEKMGYCTEMLKQLLRELIDRTVDRKFQPKILFRRSESVAERMLAAWFTFLMHDYLQNFAGRRLYELYWGIKQQMEKGPQDAVTLEAKYSLSEEKLLRASVEYREMTVFVANDTSNYSMPEIPVRVLSCDTISQVKEKCLEAKFRSVPHSERPSLTELDLEWRAGMSGRMILQDVDQTTKIDNGWRHLNTLAHYNVPDRAVLVLIPKQSSMYNLSLLSERSEKSTASMKNSPTMNRNWVGTNSSNTSKEGADNCKVFHLVKPTEHGPSENQEKMVTEIYLTRLLTMKGTLQKFINDLLESIFSSSNKTAPLPAAIKYMFDFMDAQAQEHGIMDPEVVHAWKSNALPLRFWVNLIKNPHFVFDIAKPTKVEGCLSVVAQTLMDACSTQDHQLTKDSPSSKLLFAKDMYQYRDWVDSYYSEIARIPPISDQEMSNILTEESRRHRGQFHVFSALNELYKYLDQYKEPILEALEANEHAQASRLPGRVQDMLALMESDCGRTDYESSTLGLGYNSNSRLMPRERL